MMMSAPASHIKSKCMFWCHKCEPILYYQYQLKIDESNWIEKIEGKTKHKLKLTCPTEGSHGLHHGSTQVKGSSLSSVPHHSKLPWDIVYGQRVTGELKQLASRTDRLISMQAIHPYCFGSLSSFTDLVFNCSYNVQIRQTWFHHQHVSPFSHISLLKHRAGRPSQQPSPEKTRRPNGSSCIKSTHHSTNGESSCSGRKLVAASVSKRRFGLCSISVYEHRRGLSCVHNVVELK